MSKRASSFGLQAGVYLSLILWGAQLSAGTWRGQVEILVVDNGQNAPAHTRVFLRTDAETLELQGAAAGNLHTGQTVQVIGDVTAGIAGHSGPPGPGIIRAPHITPVPVASGDASGCSAVGEQKTVVILASFPSKALLSSVTPDLMKSSFFGSGQTGSGQTGQSQTVDEFLRESSNGQTWLSGTVLGPVVMDSDYFDQPIAERDSAVRAAAALADLTPYNRIVVVAPQGQSGLESGGMALLGCDTVPSPQGDPTASSIWMGAESLVSQNETVTIAAHEMGHAFGLQHARLADYGADVLGPVNQAAAAWDSLHEYGDSFSNMGRQTAQWSAPQKSLLGWLPELSTQLVSRAGTYTLSPYETNVGTRVLRVTRQRSDDALLWLEYRQPQGTFDATLPQNAFTGLLAHYEDPALAPTVGGSTAAMYSNLVNFHPEIANTADPFLHVGQSWNDPYSSLRLTVTNVSAAGLTVSVSYAAAPVCASSVTGQAAFPSDGGTGLATVVAPAGCQWSAATTASWIQLGTSDNSGFGFTVSPNPNVSPRWAKITAGDAFLIVTQAGTSASLSLTPYSQLIPASGGTGQIAVATTAPDYAWALGTDVEWITDVETSTYQTVGPCSVRYIVAANTGAMRVGHITLDDQVFTITQDSGTPSNSPLTFTQSNPQDAPSARLNQAMAQSPVTGQAILYGGAFDTTFSSETWMWNGSNWALQHPANNPGLLAGHAMVLDKAHNQVVLFGGQDGVTFGFSNQTWVFDGVNWQLMHPASSPPARIGHAMAYDEVSHRVVMYGGSGDPGAGSDTWLWDGANWTQAVTSDSPGPRTGQAMTFDAAHGETILFGGMVIGGAPAWPSDTWAWDGSAWHLKSVALPPSGRIGHVLAYHPGLGAVTMIGGTGGKEITDNSWQYDFRRETWLWDGTQWTQQFPDNQPGPAYTLGAAWDAANQALTVHVGDDLTCTSRGPKTFALTGSKP